MSCAVQTTWSEASALRERCIAILPGQHFDAETGLHQNWHRDYSPGIGRYVQSDPIGLDGPSTYSYGAANPLTRFDLYGLQDTSTGGTEGCGSGRFHPFPPDLWFTEACDIHDRCYTTCGASKEQCDRQFRRNMQSRCLRSTSPQVLAPCLIAAEAFAFGVRENEDARTAFNKSEQAREQDCCTSQ